MYYTNSDNTFLANGSISVNVSSGTSYTQYATGTTDGSMWYDGTSGGLYIWGNGQSTLIGQSQWGATQVYENYESVLFNTEDDDASNVLSNSFVRVEDGKIIFRTYIDGKSVVPMDILQRMIKNRMKFSFVITRLGYTIEVKDAFFTDMDRILTSKALTEIGASFTYASYDYQNVMKSEAEKRKEKIEDLLREIKGGKDDIQQ